MEYKAKLPSRNSNVSHATPIKEFSTLVFGVAALLLLVYWLLGFLVDYTVDYISDGEISIKLDKPISKNSILWLKNQ